MRIIGIDVGGTHFRIGMVEDGKVTRFRKVPTASVFVSSDIIPDLAAFIRDFAGDDAFDAVAAGFPATLDRARRTIVQAPNLAFMENVPVIDGLEKELKVPVIAERDVTLALCFDAAKYGLPKEGMVCGIYFGTGVGNAILIDGRPWKGRNGAAGELGHIPVAGSDVPCGCGNTGCMECHAGGKYLAKLQPQSFPETPIGRLFAEHAGDPALLEFIDMMAIAVASEVNILDPDCLVIGGGVFNMEGFPRDVFEERVLQRVRKPYPAQNLPLLFADDEPDKSVVGAALYAQQLLEGGTK